MEPLKGLLCLQHVSFNVQSGRPYGQHSFVLKDNIQYCTACFSAAGPGFFDQTRLGRAPATESLVVSASQRRRQQRSRLALKCTEEQDSAHASRPKVSQAIQTVSHLPGSQIQRASQSCQASATGAAGRMQDWPELQTTQIPGTQTSHEGLDLPVPQIQGAL
ncbi:unnamed protein product [Polarella glacialis]|uniref:Uncharacterized protein n=1 Tax=Polarella glacialis TaxID=89957 RepID=A0A813DAR8_POLGL|nr:unnamed protein product [Polarella glacialis]CAE8583274.1 unnamed protein product [Polarella glacialis]